MSIFPKLKLNLYRIKTNFKVNSNGSQTTKERNRNTWSLITALVIVGNYFRLTKNGD